MEKTLVLVKPDGVQKKICGEVISRFERKGLSIDAIRMEQISPELAKKHYAVHQINGATNPIEAVPGSIRGDFATSIDENIVHASDAPETAAQEIALWFPEL